MNSIDQAKQILPEDEFISSTMDEKRMEIARVIAEKDAEIKRIHRDYGCELRDPYGTIWEQSAADRKRVEEKDAEIVNWKAMVHWKDVEIWKLEKRVKELEKALEYQMDGCSCDGVESCRYCGNSKQALKGKE
jgi:hypothetical protein